VASLTPTGVSRPVSDVDWCVVVAIEREATIAHNPTISEREMLKNVPTIGAGFGSEVGIDQHDRTTGTCSLVREMLEQIAPSGVQNALGQIAMHHTGDGEVFERDHVVAFDQGVGQLVERIFALIGEVLVLALQQHNRFLAVLAARRAARHPSLGHPQALLGHLARETRVPMARFLADANGLDRALERSVPAHGHTPDARQLQAPPIDQQSRLWLRGTIDNGLVHAFSRFGTRQRVVLFYRNRNHLASLFYV
jgi:hypothetical protein